MKYLILVLGLAITPIKQEILQPLPPLPSPYIRATIAQPILPSNQVETLVDALILVESSGNPHDHNKKEKTVEDRWDCGLSKEMFYI